MKLHSLLNFFSLWVVFSLPVHAFADSPLVVRETLAAAPAMIYDLGSVDVVGNSEDGRIRLKLNAMIEGNLGFPGATLSSELKILPSVEGGNSRSFQRLQLLLRTQFPTYQEVDGYAMDSEVVPATIDLQFRAFHANTIYVIEIPVGHVRCDSVVGQRVQNTMVLRLTAPTNGSGPWGVARSRRADAIEPCGGSMPPRR